MTSLQRSLPLGLLVWCAACASHDPEHMAPPGSVEAAIQGGGPVSFAENENLPYKSAVKYEGKCSGVKIGSRRFLTAIHCVPAQDTVVRLTHARDPGDPASMPDYTITKISFHPSFHLVITQDDTRDGRVHQGVYEAAVVEIAENTPDILTSQLSALTVQPGTYASGAAPLLISYGEDADSEGGSCPDTGGVKQKGSFPTITQPTVQATAPFEFVHYITEGSANNTCGGDSGGPLMKKRALEAVFDVVGIVAGTGRFTRISNIKEWIDSPAENIFAVNETGYLMNLTISTEGTIPKVNCAAMDDSAANPTEVRIHQCAGPIGPLTLKRPGWRLGSASLAGHFTILNRFDNRCLTADSNDNVVVRPCVAGQANQAWRFVDAGLAGPGATRNHPALRAFRVQNGASSAGAGTSRCLGTTGESANLNTDVRVFACDTTKKHQKWVYTR